ncbi:MAG TPA: DNA mismatch repair endonuclease MutL [Clostridiaceae bacterium]|nr:DNA mismatch repair endonuclease MutL [Clostridiaceae bacterium]
MGSIIILDENTSNKIAAGEVIERPASVVKELIENAIDAGADNIVIEIKKGGIPYIRVTDNGSGIESDDIEIAFERHATSKIRNSDDLIKISTMGFRGEALASIAAVSVVQLTTRHKRDPYGSFIEVRGGVVTERRQTGCPTGTSVVVRDLFYNTPARYKFLKKDSTESGYVADIVSRIALGNPHISFKLVSNGSTVIHTPGNNDLLSTIFSIYGKDTAKNVCEIKYQDDMAKITGYAGKPEISRSNRSQQSIYINRRYVKSKLVSSAIDEAYRTFLMKNRFAFIVLNLEINPALIDVNVHPSKMEVKFSNEQDLFRSVYSAVSSALLGRSDFRKAELQDLKLQDPFLPKDRKVLHDKYIQQSIDEDIITLKHDEVYTYDADTHEAGPGEADTLVTNTCGFDMYGAGTCDETDTDIIDIAEDDKQDTRILGEEEQVYEHAGTGPLSGASIVGQAFSTYIIMQKEDELYIIDQHAAHERIMFEHLKKKYYNNEPLAQMLLTPVNIELTYQEIKIAEEKKDFFEKLGFIFEDFGHNSVIVRSVPFMSDSSDVRDIFLEALDFVSSSNKTDINMLAEETLYRIACKAAVKANRKLDKAEIRNLVNELQSFGNPYTCPHGRPTVLKLTRYEIEKMFKRV